jgi:hypothetical protein
MKIHATTQNLPLNDQPAAIVKVTPEDNAFAKCIQNIMLTNPNFNMDYSKPVELKSESNPLVADRVDQIKADSVQLDTKSWLKTHSQLAITDAKPAQSNPDAKVMQVDERLAYTDANGNPTGDVNLALQAANNELDTKMETLLGFNDNDFEVGNKLYGTIKADQIASWYNNPLNKEKLQNEVKQVLNKFGLPSDYQNIIPRGMIKPVVDHEIALAGRQTTTPDYSKFPDNPSGRALALETWQTSSKYYVNPMDFSSLDDYKNAQTASGLNKLNDEIQSYKNFGVDVLKNEPGGLPSSHNLSLSRLKAQQGLGAGDDVQTKATWFGVTVENYLNAIQGKVGAVKLESPIERLASEVARAAAVLKPDQLKSQYPKVFNDGGLAAKYPDIFQSAISDFSNLIKTKYPGTLEYSNTLKS